jgi:hypothetical protein
VRFASLLSSIFITAIVVNPPERKLAKRTSVQCPAYIHSYTSMAFGKISISHSMKMYKSAFLYMLMKN